MRRVLRQLAAACLLLPALASAAALLQSTADASDATDSRAEAEAQFRTLIAAGDFQAALPYARRVVQLTESDPGLAGELAPAYNALAATQLRLDDMAGAESSYQHALELTEGSSGIASRSLVVPLAGLGATYAAMDQNEQAIEYLRRAVSVSRRADGLFNMSQVELMNRLIASYEVLGDELGVLAERIHAVRIVERNFGEDDQRILPAVTQLAEQYESMDEYYFARGAYEKMYQVGVKEGGAGNPVTVTALLGIARNHRLQFTLEPKSILEKALYKDPATGQAVPLMSLEPYQGPRLDHEGHKAIAEALELLRVTDSPPPRSLAAALVEMGDWHVAQGKSARAVPYYAEAWNVCATELSEEPNPMAVPRLVFYRPPTASQRNPETTLGRIVTRTAVFRLLVDEAGLPQNIVRESSDVSVTQADYLRRALENARYSPRFESGRPVPTADVQFVGEWDLLDP